MKRILSVLPGDKSGSPLITAGDIAGSVGNFGTVLPLFFAVALTTGMSLSLMLLLCGGWYIITGLVYKIPIPVEPLKAVAAVAIAGGVTPLMIAASGILTGILFLLLGLTGKMQWLSRQISGPVIRGIQLALGLILLKSAIIDFGIRDIPFFVLCIGIIILFFIGQRRHDLPDLSALTILGVGVAALVWTTGLPSVTYPTLPGLVFPGFSDYVTAGVQLVLPQIPLTLANAVLATALLASELYQRQVSPDRLSLTIGAMSLSTSLLGGFPMCHGAGGVAAHYRFGARNGSAMIIGGLVLIGAATLLTDPRTLAVIPKGVFGALLLAVAIELIRHGLKTENRLVTGVMAVIAVPAGIVAAFIAGLILSGAIRYRQIAEQKRSGDP